MTTIFISHSSRDNDLVRTLHERLRARGYETLFLDFDPEHGIPAGTKWELELYRQLAQCKAVIFLCSQHWQASRWCFAEAVYAKMAGKELFPLEIDAGAVPELLTDRQVIRLSEGEEAAYDRLWSGLTRAGVDPHRDFAWQPLRTPYPGFLPFDTDEAAVFYGRDNEIRDGLDLFNVVWDRRFELTQPRLVVILGPSGSGKSSLARAGLLPRLRKQPDRWLTLKPIEAQGGLLRGFEAAVDAALTPQIQPETAVRLRVLLDAMQGRDAPLAEVESADPAIASPVPILLIDQFEQLLNATRMSGEVSVLSTLRKALAVAAHLRPRKSGLRSSRRSCL